MIRKTGRHQMVSEKSKRHSECLKNEHVLTIDGAVLTEITNGQVLCHYWICKNIFFPKCNIQDG